MAGRLWHFNITDGGYPSIPKECSLDEAVAAGGSVASLSPGRWDFQVSFLTYWWHAQCLHLLYMWMVTGENFVSYCLLLKRISIDFQNWLACSCFSMCQRYWKRHETHHEMFINIVIYCGLSRFSSVTLHLSDKLISGN